MGKQINAKYKNENNLVYKIAQEAKELSLYNSKLVKPILFLQQIHSNYIFEISNSCTFINNIVASADGFFTQQNCTLVIRTADCIPILFYNKGIGVFGGIHAGWRGLKDGIIEQMFIKIKNRHPEIVIKDTVIFFGPHISMENYQVGEEFRDIFKEKYLKTINERLFLSLIDVAKDNLKEIGVIKINFNQLTDSDHFYSHRQGDFRRNLSIIGLELQPDARS